MKKIIAAVSACLLLLSACSVNAKTRGTTVITVPGAADTALPQQIIFAVDRDADGYLSVAAENFCRKVNSLSTGEFVLTSNKSGDPLDDFKSGKTGFILLDGDKTAELHPFFAITNERFRYGSYESFSMACNSEQVLRRLSEVSGTKVFAAYYTGSNILARQSDLDPLLFPIFDTTSESEAAVEELEIITIPGSGTGIPLSLPGVLVNEISSSSERIGKLSAGNMVIELSIPELVAFEHVSIAADNDNYEGVVLTRTFHSVTPMWLIISPSIYDSFSTADLAAISEAAACMSGDVDYVCLEREQSQLDALGDKEVTVSNDFKSTRAKIFRSEAARLAKAPAEEKYFRELLDKLQ